MNFHVKFDKFTFPKFYHINKAQIQKVFKLDF